MVHPCCVLLCSPRHVAPLRRRSCSTCPCCFRGELAAAPLQCTHTVVTDTRSMALAGEPIPPFCFAAHPHRPDANRYRGHAAHNRQQHTPHTPASHVACSNRSTHGVRHAASSDGAQHRCSSAPARSARSSRGLAQRSRHSVAVQAHVSALHPPPRCRALGVRACSRAPAQVAAGAARCNYVRHVAPVAAVG